MTKEEAIKLAEEVFDEEYSGLDKDSFLIGFQEAYNALTALYKDNFELVKRMREAQKQWKDGDPFDGTEMELAKRMCEAEREVDEYLEKMESIDRRKALQAENTEFDYGHNVKHYSED